MTATDVRIRRLESGWHQHTPDGDNISTDAARAVAAAYDELARANGWRALVDEALGLHMVDSGLGSPYTNQTHAARPLDAAGWARAASVIADFYGGGEGGPFILFSAWPTADLSPYGLQLGGHPPFMVRPALLEAPLVRGIRVVRVTTLSELRDAERVLIEGYPVPELQPWHAGVWLREDTLGTGWNFFVAYAGDEPVATAASWAGAGVTCVELVATQPGHRGRGIGGAVTAAASVVAPGQAAALVSSDLGRPVYERLGYLPVLRHTVWLGSRPPM
jgi:GNAT superfamily N-acetyltransferase